MRKYYIYENIYIVLFLPTDIILQQLLIRAQTNHSTWAQITRVDSIQRTDTRVRTTTNQTTRHSFLSKRKAAETRPSGRRARLYSRSSCRDYSPPINVWLCSCEQSSYSFPSAVCVYLYTCVCRRAAALDFGKAIACVGWEREKELVCTAWSAHGLSSRVSSRVLLLLTGGCFIAFVRLSAQQR